MPKRHPTLSCAWLVLFRPTNANAGRGLQPRSKRLQGLIAFEREWRGYKPRPALIFGFIVGRNKALRATARKAFPASAWLLLSYCFVKQLKQFYSNYTDN